MVPSRKDQILTLTAPAGDCATAIAALSATERVIEMLNSELSETFSTSPEKLVVEMCDHLRFMQQIIENSKRREYLLRYSVQVHVQLVS